MVSLVCVQMVLATTALAQPAQTSSVDVSVEVESLQFVGDVDASRRERFIQSVHEGLPKSTTAAPRQYTVSGTITVVDRDHSIELVAVDGTGAEVARTRSSCEVCGLDEALESAQGAASTMLNKLVALQSGPPTLRITVQQPDAEVRIDGRVVGVAPVSLEVEPGEHVVEVRKAGFVAQARTVDAVEGVEEVVRFELSAQPRRSVRVPVGWTLVGLGAASSVAGLTFLALDGSEVRTLCSGSNVDADGDCRFEHGTLGYGIGFTVAGVSAVAVGLVLALYKPKHTPGRRAYVRPSLGGLVGRF